MVFLVSSGTAMCQLFSLKTNPVDLVSLGWKADIAKCVNYRCSCFDLDTVQVMAFVSLKVYVKHVIIV